MKTRIPHSCPLATEADIRSVTDALRAGHFSQGEEVAALERDLCAKFGRAEAVAVSSGTAALALALVALDIQEGDSVVLPSYTCSNLYAAVGYAGAAPLCADVGRAHVCIKADNVVDLMASHSPKAAIVPHMFGFRADVEGIRALGLPVIEDCAQSAGGQYADGSPMGGKGDIAVLSFYATKLLPAGEGGACLTDDPGLAAALRAFRNSDEQSLRAKAFNFKLSDMAAALARSKLNALAENLATRERIAARYDQAFGSRSFRIAFGLSQPVCFRYLLRVERDIGRILRLCDEAGIVCRKPVWAPLHCELGGVCPETELRHETLVSVPIYPGLGPDEVERICHELSAILSAAD